ncbi:MAG: hypothetical protein UW18_C0015G0008 [Microgenomates group bacterium GW2011_GWF1_44_10]|nr:MAG: hypothetical protein UW18_C0015G0008 [Microgenomates group bacterium GW2011_GWF1_44_10]
MYGGNEYGSIPYGGDGGPYSINYTSTLDDTVTPTDSIIRAVTRIISETATITETFFDTVAGHGLAFMDTITPSEVFRRAITRINSEVVTLTEVFTKSYGRFIVFLDTFSGLTDTMTRSIGRFYTFLDTTTLEEIYSRTVGRLRSFSETGTLTEVFGTIKGYYATLTDTFSGLTDTIQRAATRSLSETLTLSDSIRKYLNGLLLNVWTKVAKQTASWVKTAKTTDTWTKVAKSVSSIWTKTEKPY